jgi:hypothetical protein
MDMSDVITYPLSAAIEFCEQLDNMQDQRDLAMKVISRLELERDDALSQIVQAECRAERFCQERDEAREALMKIEDLFIDGTDIYADREQMGMIARTALEETK